LERRQAASGATLIEERSEELGIKERADKYLEQGMASTGNLHESIPIYIV